MKFAIVFAALFALACAAPVENEVQIISQTSRVEPEDFEHSFETSDGTIVQAQGKLLNVGTDHESLDVKGSFQYYGPDGQLYRIIYTADENGFQPQGEHLPVA